MRTCEKAGNHAVKSVTKSRGPIAVVAPSRPPPQPLRGRSLICNEPAPPVIILRLRDHVITRARINAIDLSHLSDSIKNVRFLGQFEFKDLRDSDEASVHLNSKIARIKFSSATN